jgi:Hypervirulence associated proteins TUDOR domain
MPKNLKVGDRVTWNAEAGHLSGTIIKKHTEDIAYKGYTHHASVDESQYEIKGDKGDHIALHKLRRRLGQTAVWPLASSPPAQNVTNKNRRATRA